MFLQNLKNITTFIFDVDGTLTPSRKKIDKDFEKFFINFCKNNLDEYFELKQNGDDKRKTELLISLIIGSINQIDNIAIKPSDNLLDKVKNKISEN